MSQLSIEEQHVKDLLKQAILELFQEQRELLYDLLAEVIEDSALANAIKEGESSETVGRTDIFHLLESAA